MNIILCGFMGCGKTTVGKLLAKKCGKIFIDTDDIIEKQQGIPVSRIFDTKGEAFFRDLEHAVCRQIAVSDNLVVSTGGGALTFVRNVQLFKQRGAIIFLDVPFAVLAERVGGSDSRPLFRDVQQAKQLYEARVPLYQSAADTAVDGAGTPEQVAQRIMEALDLL